MQSRQSGHDTPAPAKTTLTQIPLAAQGPVSAALGQHDAAYGAVTTASGLVLHNPGQQIDARFTAQGVTLNIGTTSATGISNQVQDQLGFELQSIGHGSNPDTLTRIEPVAPTADANRVSYVHPSLTEWYLNGPAGLEQGWTIAEAPAGQGTAPLTLSLRLTGNLAGKAQLANDAFTFTGSPITYRGLTAVDAAGKTIPAHLALDGDHLSITVDDAKARYPLTIDPMVQQAELTASDGTANDNFGVSLTLSADGNTLAVGSYAKAVSGHYGQGAAYVFTRSAGVWTQQQELTSSDGADYDLFGTSLSLSSDGNTLAVGAKNKTVSGQGGQGAAYVFTRSAGVWTQQQALTANDGAASDSFGNSIALSSDAGTLAVGAINKTVSGHDYQGAAYVFTRSAGVWTQQQALTANDGADSDSFGNSIALSSDGNTLGVGANQKTVSGNDSQGAAYVFTRSAGVWTQQQELTASDGASNDNFGCSIALSSDAGTLAVGANTKTVGSNRAQGAAYVFTRSAGVWIQQQALTASDGASNDGFGTSLSLSSDAGTLAVGANTKTVSGHDFQGAANVFTQTAGVWSQQQELTASDGADYDYFGTSLSLSSDGNTLAVGAYSKTVGSNGAQGASYIFAAPSLTATVAVASKAYTGTSSATITGCTLTGVVSPDVVTCNYASATATFVSGAVGNGRQVNITGLSLSGANAGKYSLPSTATSSANITPAPLTATVTASNKPYNGNATATLTGCTLTGVISPEQVSCVYSGAAASFASPSAGTGKTVTATGLTLTGIDAGNYTAPATATGTASITPLTLSGSVTVASKIYNGNTTASLSGCSLTGVLGSDNVSCNTSAASASFASPSAGVGKTVTASGLTLSGPAASNYTAPASATGSGNITPLTLGASVTAISKTYDANTTASLSGCTLTGVVGSDQVSCNTSAATASFASASAGVGKTVTATGLTLSGTASGNYTAPASATGSGNITPLALGASVTAATRSYNGTTTASLSGCSLTGIIGSDNVSCNTSAATATFADANAGTGIAITASGLSLTGPASGNYTAPVSATGSGDITPASVSASVSAASKAWDGNTSATLSGCSLSGVIIPDAVSCDTSGATATFGSSDVGTGIPVSVSGLALSGAAASNYGLASTSATTSADITPPLAIIGLTATPSSYIWTSAAKVTLQANVSSLIPGNKPNGTVNFMDGGTIVATAVGLTNAGIARANVKLVPGSHSLTAVYAGDAQNAGNTSTVQSVTVAKAEQTTVTLSAGTTTLGKGIATTLTASGGNTPGAWSLQLTGTTGTATCSLRGVTLRATGGTGTCSVTATRGESTYYNAATSAPLTISVTP